MGQSPNSASYNQDKRGLPFFQGNADFGEKTPLTRVWCESPIKLAKKNDILISVRAPIGAMNFADQNCCIGRGLASLTVSDELCDRMYIWYAISSRVEDLVKKGTGSTFKAINKATLAEQDIPLPSIEEQRRIATVLDKASGLIALRKRQLELLDELVKARFIEMFGDPVTNPMGWPILSLGQLGEFKNGLNFRSNDNGYTLLILGVSDFQSKTTLSDFEGVKSVSLNVKPNEDYYLANGDIVFVRSNGNKNLVGRSILVYPGNLAVTFSGFCIRFRLLKANISAVYINFLLHNKSAKARLLFDGRGANIINLNQEMLSRQEIPIPPYKRQIEFAEFVEKTDQLRLEMLRGLDTMGTSYNALFQEYFG